MVSHVDILREIEIRYEGTISRLLTRRKVSPRSQSPELT
jgi:hypothetical protein